MGLSPTKSEVRKMAKLVDQEHESAEALASAVLDLAYRMYENKPHHALLFHQDDMWIVKAGFATPLQADKWATSRGLQPGEAVIVPIQHEGES